MKQKIKRFFYYQYQGQNQSTTFKLRPIFKHLLICLLLLIFFLLIAQENWSFNEYGVIEFKKSITKLFQFDNFSTYYVANLTFYSFKLLYLTIKTAIVGTFIGFLFACLTASLSSKNIFPIKINWLIKSFLLLLRAFPELVFIAFFTKFLNAELALFAIFAWFSWLWLHKYYLEILENLDWSSFYIALNQGNSRLNAFYKQIWPLIINRFVALFLYSFESNMRWASILATLGVSGIGVLIKYAGENSYRFNELGIPLSVLINFIFLLELINIWLKKIVFENKSKNYEIKKIKSKIFHFHNWKTYFKIMLFLIIAVFSIYVLITLNWNVLNFEIAQRFLKSFWNPNWSHFDLYKNETNPFYFIFQSLAFAFLIVILVIFLTTIVLPFLAFKTSNNYIIFFTRFINLFWRAMPTLAIFYIFNPIFNSPIALLLIILSINETTALVKQLWESVDNLEQAQINNLKMMGWSKIKIYFHFVLPSIKYDFFSLLCVTFDICLRNSITYSALSRGNLIIGTQISFYLDTQAFRPETAMAYVWIATFMILFTNAFLNLIKKIMKQEITWLSFKNLTKTKIFNHMIWKKRLI
ncbi:ABC transporter permease subunit [Mycoplasmopsis gallinarum]